jgi:hypothetical protein
MVSQPSKALLLVFPLTGAIELARRVEDKKIAEDGQHKLDPGIVFIKQTVRPAHNTPLNLPESFIRYLMPAVPSGYCMPWPMLVLVPW